ALVVEDAERVADPERRRHHRVLDGAVVDGVVLVRALPRELVRERRVDRLVVVERAAAEVVEAERERDERERDPETALGARLRPRGLDLRLLRLGFPSLA